MVRVEGRARALYGPVKRVWKSRGSGAGSGGTEAQAQAAAMPVTTPAGPGRRGGRAGAGGQSDGVSLPLAVPVHEDTVTVPVTETVPASAARCGTQAARRLPTAAPTVTSR